MNEERIREAFSQVHTDAAIDRGVMERILRNGYQSREKGAHPDSEGKAARRRFSLRQKGVAAAAIAAILLFGAVQIPQVATYADSVIEGFTAIFHFRGHEVKQEGGFLHISEDAGRQWQKYDHLSEIEDEIGLKLLKYDGADERKGSWTYYTSSAKESGNIKEEVYEYTFTNRYYITGDLRNVSVQSYGSADTVNQISYEPGKVFHSPISYQIIILADKYGELSKDRDFEDGNKDIDLEDVKAELYYCENLDTEVLIYQVYTDGPVAWNQAESRKTTFMRFYYKGVYYEYCGQVDVETMLDMARQLHE